MSTDLRHTRRVLTACSFVWVVAFAVAVTRVGVWWTVAGLAWALPLVLAAVAGLARVLRPRFTPGEGVVVAPALS